MLVLTIGCKPDTYECTCFNSETAWAPYKANDIVDFKEKKNVQPSFFFKQLIMTDFSSTADYAFTRKKLILQAGKYCKCSYSARDKKNNFIWSLYSENFAEKKLKKTKVYNLPIIKTLDISFNDFAFNLEIDSNNAPVIDTNNIDNIEVLKNIQIGKYLYQEVYTIKMDTLKFPKQNYWKMLITKDYGIISYFTRSPKEEWIRQ